MVSERNYEEAVGFHETEIPEIRVGANYSRTVLAAEFRDYAGHRLTLWLGGNGLVVFEEDGGREIFRTQI